METCCAGHTRLGEGPLVTSARKSFARRALWVTAMSCAVVVGASRAPAQGKPPARVVSGRVVDSVGVSAAGALVVALNTRGELVSRTLSGSAGAFALALPITEPVDVYAMIVGYEPSDAIAIKGDTPSQAITLSLPAIRVRPSLAKSRARVCGALGNSGSDAALLWEEARKALASSRLPYGAERVTASVSFFEHLAQENGKSMSGQYVRERDVSAHRPFSSLPPDSIVTAGYVVETRDGVSYYAPDADVLLSGAFADAHCFSVLAVSQDDADRVGLSFDLRKSRPDIKDIVGTIWFDRQTLALRRIEFGYSNVPPGFARAGVGGTLDFAHLPNGMWLISRWEIRMPQGQIDTRLALQHSQVRSRQQITVDALRVAGGKVRRVSVGGAVIPVEDGRQ